VQRNVAADPVFGEALLRESIHTMLTGDVDTGKAILRDYSQVCFEELAREQAGGSHMSNTATFGRPFSRMGTRAVEGNLTQLGFLIER
jgi:hypothetical protein